MKKLSPVQRFIKLIQIDKKDIIQIIIYAVISGLLSLSLPLGIQAIINLIQAGIVSVSWLILVFIVVLCVVLVGYLKLMQIKITEHIQQKIFIRSSLDFSVRMPKLKYELLQKHNILELSNRFFDTINIQKGFAKIILDYSAAILEIIFGLLLLTLYHPFFILYGFFLFVLLFSIFYFSYNIGIESSIKESKYKYKVAYWIQEIAKNNILFKNFQHLDFAVEENNKNLEDYLNYRKKHFTVLVNQYIQLIVFKAIITLSLLIVGGYLVINQQMNIGQFIAAEIIILLVINSVEKIIVGLEVFYDVITSVEKVGEVLDMELDVIQKSEKIYDNINIELENISYQYLDKTENILKDISLKIIQNEHVIFNGNNGSGKSTLLKVLAGIITPKSGLMFLNDGNYNKIELDNYQNSVGYIPSQCFLFKGTFIENIVLNNSYSEDYLKKVIQSLHLSNFLKQLSKSWHTELQLNGNQIPSSIIQKIILARTLIKNPKILILEDALDKIDDKEICSIIDFIIEECKEKTLIVVSKNEYWSKKIKKTITLTNGKVIC
jgi:ABC-type bacteriocin/lantibiotic exporter with double-glycine peptidase domain